MSLPHNRNRGAEVVALAQYALGFRPAQSLVLVSGDRASSPTVLRVDLAGVPDVLHRLVSHVQRTHARRVFALAFTDSDEQAGAALAEIGLALAGAGIEAVPMRVTSTTYTDPDTPGGDPRPLSDVESTRTAAHHTLAGVSVAPDRGMLIPPVSDADARNVARKRAALAVPVDPDTILSTWAAVHSSPWTTAAETLGDLAVSLTDRHVRDAVLLLLVGAPAAVVAAAAHGNATEGDASTALNVVLRDGGAPPPTDAQRWKDTLTQIATHTDPDTVSAPAWTLLAFTAWWDGDGARAHQAITRALNADPTHRLAELIHDLIAAHVAPGWAR